VRWLARHGRLARQAAEQRRPRGWEHGALAQFGTDAAGVRGGAGRERCWPPTRFASERWEREYTAVSAAG
jgi:hypothetical protein